MVDVRWVVLRYAHDLKRARKDQSYQRGARPAKTSDAVRATAAAQARLRACWPVMVSTHRSTA